MTAMFLRPGAVATLDRMGRLDPGDYLPVRPVRAALRDHLGRSARLVPMPDYDGSQPCTQHPLESFFPDYDDDRQPADLAYATECAKRVCLDCPFLLQCREYAVAHEPYGIWGATAPHGRAMIRKERRQVLVQPGSPMHDRLLETVDGASVA